MVIFHSYVAVYQRVSLITSPSLPVKSPFLPVSRRHLARSPAAVREPGGAGGLAERGVEL